MLMTESKVIMEVTPYATMQTNNMTVPIVFNILKRKKKKKLQSHKKRI